MSRIERGGANPSLDAIEKLADALGVEVMALFDSPTTKAAAKPVAAPIAVPFADDGTCFNPSAKRKRTGKFSVGGKGRGNVIQFQDFDEALAYLKSMPTARWWRPNKVGNWGLVTAVRWGALPKKY